MGNNATDTNHFILGIFLSKPKAWHIIDARSAAYIIKGGKPPLHIITRQRAYTFGLMICNTPC